MVDLDPVRAAKVAGYAPEGRNRGYRLLKLPKVQAAINRVRNMIEGEIKYTAIEAMKECEEAMKFARLTQNANALCKAIELRAKLQGLLIEKHDIRSVAAFQIKITGIDGPAPAPTPQVQAVMDVLKLPSTATIVEDKGE